MIYVANWVKTLLDKEYVRSYDTDEYIWCYVKNNDVKTMIYLKEYDDGYKFSFPLNNGSSYVCKLNNKYDVYIDNIINGYL